MSKVKLPKQITVGRSTYKIEAQKHLLDEDGTPLDCMGQISFKQGSIKISTKYPAAEVRNTFWHEMTHAVLREMGHDLCDNERFVTAFANTLSDAIDSAKF